MQSPAHIVGETARGGQRRCDNEQRLDNGGMKFNNGQMEEFNPFIASLNGYFFEPWREVRCPITSDTNWYQGTNTWRQEINYVDYLT